MTTQAYRFEVAEARSFRHPIFPNISKTTFLMSASRLPKDLPTGANARDPVGMNRRVYRDVTESLRGNEAYPGSFDLMNLGITILADKINPIDKKTFDVFIRPEDGIVNGAHTAKIIETCQDDDSIPLEQYVEVKVVTGINQTDYDELKADIAKGQNTGIAVRDQSIYDIQGIFDSIKETIKNEDWAEDVAWRESDPGRIDVRDLISVMEAFNVIDFKASSGTHPIQAYEKWSVPLTKFADDFRNNTAPCRRKYAALEPLLIEALELYDRIRHDFRGIFNSEVSPAAGRLRIVEEAPVRQKVFDFPFSKQDPAQFRLTKGAAFPILAAFRNCASYDEEKHKAEWIGGFEAVKALWKEAGPELVRETYEARKSIGNTPDVLGKNRSHWSNLFRLVKVRVLEKQLESRN